MISKKPFPFTHHIFILWNHGFFAFQRKLIEKGFTKCLSPSKNLEKEILPQSMKFKGLLIILDLLLKHFQNKAASMLKMERIVSSMN